MVVEPDPYVRAMAVDALEREGFTIIEAALADAAATLLKGRTDLRVVVTEAAMPGALNGFDLARIARAHDPRIAVIITAGALPPGFSGNAPDARFIPKPYRMADLIRVIRQQTAGQLGPD
jgi:DNA-binding NtrC family response regulator